MYRTLAEDAPERRSWAWPSRDVETALKGGEIEVAKWLYQEPKVQCTKSAIVYAAGKGHLEVLILKYLVDAQGIGVGPSDAGCMVEFAANSGQGEVLHYLEAT